jgi:hypothetical protein
MHSKSTSINESSLASRLRTLLPDTYQAAPASPAPMRSAGLKYTPEGLVAWDEIWQSFCDLALAGGPPHRGTLLSPGTPADIAANPTAYSQITTELCRGLHLVTGLYAQPAPTPGWVRLDCTSAAMADWLTRAIAMENIAATFRGLALYLPAGPAFRIEKEIKNVITAVAKTTHYWLHHTSPDSQQAIADLLRTLNAESPLLQPDGYDPNAVISTAPPNDPVISTAPPKNAVISTGGATRRSGETPVFLSTPTMNSNFATEAIAAAIQAATGLQRSPHTYPTWLGIDCLTVPTAIAITRTLIACNVLSRREAATAFLPLNPTQDPEGNLATQAFLTAYTAHTAQ